MIFRIVSALFALLFGAAAALQWNDPDPIPWMAIYGAAAIVSAWGVVRRVPAVVAAPIMLVALVWAMTIAPRVAGKVPLGEVFSSFEMKSPLVEEMREAIGLLVVALWMAVTAIAAFRGRLPPPMPVGHDRSRNKSIRR